ncbi:MAG: hypothetical protein ACLU9S_04080 [Oscillospiraceae bacterium]
MKFKPLSLACLAAASCVFSAVCLFRIGALENQISLLESNTSHQFSILRDDISETRSQMRSALEEQTNLLSSPGHPIHGTGYEKPPGVGILHRLSQGVHPRRHPGFCGSGRPAVSPDAGGRQPIPTGCRCLFFRKPDRHGAAGGGWRAVRSQAVEWHFNPLFDYLPNVYLSFDGDESGVQRGTPWIPKTQGLLTAEVYASGYAQVEQMDIVAVLDGEEIWRAAADYPATKRQKECVTATTKAAVPAIAMPTPEDYKPGQGQQLLLLSGPKLADSRGQFSLQLYADITRPSRPALLRPWAGAYTGGQPGQTGHRPRAALPGLQRLRRPGADTPRQADDRLFR